MAVDTLENDALTINRVARLAVFQLEKGNFTQTHVPGDIFRDSLLIQNLQNLVVEAG